MRPCAPLALLLGAVALLPPAQAEDAARRGVVEQKAALMQRVLEDSPVVRRVRASGDDEAKHVLAAAMASYLQAVAHIREGRIGAGEAAINESMALIGRARQMVPDAAARRAEERARHAQLLESTQGMLASARRHLERGAAPAAQAEAARADLAGAAELVASAHKSAAGERYDEANRSLAAAEQAVLAALSRALGSATLDYTPRFDSPAQEFRYEDERFGSLRRLVPRALDEFKPPEDALRQVQGYLSQGVALREEAGRQAARGDTGAALHTIRNATELLRRALAAAGLAVQTQ